MTSMLHVTPEEAVEYLQGTLTEQREFEIGEHLAGCEECAMTARGIVDWQESLQSWTAEAHGAAFWSARVKAAVDAAGANAENAQWRERLLRWGGQAAGAVGGAVRVVLESPGKASRIVAEGLQALAHPGAVWQFATVPAEAPVRGAADEGPSSIVVAVSRNHPRMRVAVSGQSGEVVVHLEAAPPARRVPLVLLVPAGVEGTPRVAELERRPGVEFLIARFEGVGPGEYTVAFEPAT